MSVVWEDPPASGYGAWSRRLEPFMKRKGEWGRLPELYSRSMVTALTKRKVQYQPGKWEFRAGTQPDDKRVLVYVRYLGLE